MSYKAVIFDMGSVLCNSSIGYYEKTNGLTPGTVGRAFREPGHMELRKKFLIGEITAEEYEPIFTEHVKKMNPGMELPDSIAWVSSTRHVVGTDILKNEHMHKVALLVRKNGYKIAVLTNNFWFDNEKTVSNVYFDPSLFDAVVESCKVGLSKPDKRIYELTLEKLGCEGHEAIFLDDKQPNLTPARELGIKTIWVQNQETAAKELLDILNIP